MFSHFAGEDTKEEQNKQLSLGNEPGTEHY